MEWMLLTIAFILGMGVMWAMVMGMIWLSQRCEPLQEGYRPEDDVQPTNPPQKSGVPTHVNCPCNTDHWTKRQLNQPNWRQQ